MKENELEIWKTQEDSAKKTLEMGKLKAEIATKEIEIDKHKLEIKKQKNETIKRLEYTYDLRQFAKKKISRLPRFPRNLELQRKSRSRR